MSEKVNHPAHYGGADNPYEAIKVIEAWGLGFCLGNTVKYISRAGRKPGARAELDLRKALWYRVSYLTQDGHQPTTSEDLALYDRLAGATPIHASPMKHQATPDEKVGLMGGRFKTEWGNSALHGNLRGWIQYRKLVESGVGTALVR